MIGEQHDDHCQLTAEGVDWSIDRGQRPMWCVSRRMPDGSKHTVAVLDLTRFEWERYCERALALLDERYPGWRDPLDATADRDDTAARTA
jgi:hypothetical protein